MDVVFLPKWLKVESLKVAKEAEEKEADAEAMMIEIQVPHGVKVEEEGEDLNIENNIRKNTEKFITI